MYISGLNISINKFMFYEVFNERCVTLAINSLDKNNMTNRVYVAGQATLFPFTPPKHSDSLCIPVQTWEFLCHTLYLKRYPFLLGPKGCGKSSIAKELADAMGMEYFAFDMDRLLSRKRCSWED